MKQTSRRMVNYLVPHQPHPGVSRSSSTAPDASSDLQSSYDYSSDTSDTPDTAANNRIIHQDRIGEALAPDLSGDVEELWQQTLQAIKADHNTLYGIARMAKPSLEGDALTLATKFPFHQKRLNEAKNRSIIATAVSELRGTDTSISCIVATVNKPENSDISNLCNIFGGAELL